jgi:NDP-sugar pyrophosphorylase family protein
MGPLKLIDDLPENFLVMNGDILTDLNYADFYNEHSSANRLFTISAYIREQKIDYGVLESDANGHLTGFLEKPTTPYNVSMGIYMVSSRVLKYIPLNAPYGFDSLMIDLLKEKDTVNVRPFAGYWLDIGRPDDYMQAIEEFSDMKNKFLPE